jgi:hypothetical protein
MKDTIVDALGNPVIVGNWYGYSRNDGGHSHTTIGRVSKVTEGDGRYTPPKARLVDCVVKRYLYGHPTDFRKDEKPADVTMAAAMIFPVPSMD